MPIDADFSATVRGHVTADLAREFGDVLSEHRVRAEVLAATQDLDGQIVPEALGEMAHRLAHYRLAVLAGVEV
ncbi:hypothetical protein [Pseudonocardia sp. N23]|uniref:hypothetical protein n=1 Tax=Pseudonocardia sp. N23 TaxID=1987376 RepID=UPI000BFC2E17|nr:hypothetical protein [Pseudonocardia sp. N23]